MVTEPPLVRRKVGAVTSLDPRIVAGLQTAPQEMPFLVAKVVQRLVAVAAKHGATFDWETLELKVTRNAFGDLEIRARMEVEA